jgi:hypothetical protein
VDKEYSQIGIKHDFSHKQELNEIFKNL